MSFKDLYKDLEKFIDDPDDRWKLCVRVKRGLGDTSALQGMYKDQVRLSLMTILLMLLRLILENCREWKMGCVIVSLDLERAFENVKLSALLRQWEKRGVPTRLRYAAYKEIAGNRFVRYSLGAIRTDYLKKQVGQVWGW